MALGFLFIGLKYCCKLLSAEYEDLYSIYCWSWKMYFTRVSMYSWDELPSTLETF